MEEKKFCVYCHTAPDGRRYIGITSRKPEKRWNYGNGYSGNEYFTRAINKYGWDSFKHEILMVDLTIDEASEEEIRLIKEYRTAEREYGFNLDLGGIHGRKLLSDETKKKIGDSHRGRYTEAQWEATRNRKKIEYHHTDEAKKKIGDSRRGKPLSEEQKRRLSEAHKGIRPSEENLRLLKAIHQRPVIMRNLDGEDIKEFPSLKDAEAETGIRYQCISACCRGKYKQAGGYKWRYANKDGQTDAF